MDTEVPFRPATILLVEDERIVHRIILKLLRKAGYDVLSAMTSDEALDYCSGQNRRSIDLLLTDVMLPGMTGPELSAKIKTLYPQMQTIYMSGYTRAIVQDKGLLSDHDPFMEKSEVVFLLEDTIRKLLDKKKER